MNHIHRQDQRSQICSSSCGEGNAATLQAAAECLLTDQLRLLISAACVARLGAAQMSLDDWRDVEQEVKQRLISRPLTQH